MPITLKAARVNAGLTQKDASKKLNISNRTLCSWENGKTIPNAANIDAICKLYNTTYDELIFFNHRSALSE